MVFNEEIAKILSNYQIDDSLGKLCLLAIYHDLQADTIIPEDVLKKINLTHIVDKDYTTDTIKWNIPLFSGGIADPFDWVEDWMAPFGRIGGAARKGTKKEVMVRMKKWFAANPEYRRDDVFAARDLYFRTEQPKAQFVKTSHKFITEGAGATATSMLLLWCEKVKESKGPAGANPMMKGRIVQ